MKRFKVIEHAQLVLENGIIWDGMMLIDGDRIAAFGAKGSVDIPADAERIDAHGKYVGPGFVDIHVHGGGGHSICHDASRASAYFLEHGETSILAATDYSMTKKDFLDAIRTLKADLPQAKTVRGMYMEGPYTNPNYGCNTHLNPWRHGILPEEYEPIVDEAGSLARVWVVAPEREALLPFLAYARRVNPQVCFAVGHSEATPEQIRAMGSAYRPTLLTHAMNATGRRPVEPGLRAYGPDEYFLQDREAYTELISDSLAIHVHPDMQRLLVHAKGVDRMILVTDSTPFRFTNPARFAHVQDLNFDDQGNLAGSRMTMDMACRNIMAHTNCGIAQAFIMASLNPARAVGLAGERGSIERGKIADLVFVDDRFTPDRVMLGGTLY